MTCGKLDAVVKLEDMSLAGLSIHLIFDMRCVCLCVIYVLCVMCVKCAACVLKCALCLCDMFCVLCVIYAMCVCA